MTYLDLSKVSLAEANILYTESVRIIIATLTDVTKWH